MPPENAGPARLFIGTDLVQLSRVDESLSQFGERFCRRLLTDAEYEFVKAVPSLFTERIGTRFAAKEATLKALRLVDIGTSWKDIEVVATETGACDLVLHGTAKAAALEMNAGPFSVSLTHEGDYAMAFVVAQPCQPQVACHERSV